MKYRFENNSNININTIKKNQIRNCLFRYLRDCEAIDCQTSKALLWYVTWYRRSIRDIDAPGLSFSMKDNACINQESSSYKSLDYETKLKTFRIFQRHMEANLPEPIRFLENIIEGQKTKDHDYVYFYQNESLEYQKIILRAFNDIAKNIHSFLRDQPPHPDYPARIQKANLRRQGMRR